MTYFERDMKIRLIQICLKYFCLFCLKSIKYRNSR